MRICCFCWMHIDKNINNRRHNMLMLWVTTRTGLRPLLLTKHFGFLVLHCCSSVFPFRLKHSVLATVSLRLLLLNNQSALIGQLQHAWASTADNNRAAVLNQFLHAKLAAGHKLYKCVTRWHSVMSQIHRIKGGTTDEAFQEQCWLWERGASVGVDFELFFYF